MRIWLAPSAYAPHRGGVEQLSAQLAAGLQLRGHVVTVITNRHPAELPVQQVVDGVPVHRLPFRSPGRDLKALVAFVRGWSSCLQCLHELVRTSGRPDVLHVHCPSSQTAVLTWWARRHGIPLVVTTHGEVAMDAHDIYRRSAYLRTVLRTASHSASVLTACSEWARTAAAGVAPRFVSATVVRNAVDLSAWEGLPARPGQDTVVAWGRLVPQKGFDLLLVAFAELRARRPSAALLLGGDGPERARLEGLAGSGVHFLGELDRVGVRGLLAKADVVAVPSRIEPFGLVALEALAAGRPVVVAARTGLAEATGQVGVAVEVNDPTAFAAALERLLDEPFDAAATTAHLQTLSWGTLLDGYEAVYSSVEGPSRR